MVYLSKPILSIIYLLRLFFDHYAVVQSIWFWG